MKQKTIKLITFALISFFLYISSSESQAGTYKRDDLLAQITGTTYYLDAVYGNDSNNGSQASPWKTLAKSKLMTAAGDGVILNSGDYGAYQESNNSGRSNYILYIANENSTVNFDQIAITNTSPTDSFLVFHGINVKPYWIDPCGTGQTGCSDPQYAYSTQSTYSKTANAITITNANHVKIIDCHIEGQNKHLTGFGADISGSQDIDIDHCEITKTTRGVNFGTVSSGINILNNHIHDIAASAIQEGNVFCSDVLIQGNNIHNSKYSALDDYAPRVDGTNYHGSGVVLRAGNVTIRNNVIHDGFPSAGIMTYSDDVGGTPHYNNVLIENNLLYDIHTSYIMRFYKLGENLIVRNNTLIGIDRIGNGYQIFETALAIHSIDTIGTPHATISNNKFIGAVMVDSQYTTMNNNIMVGYSDAGVWQCNPLPDGNTVMSCKSYDVPARNEFTDLFSCGADCNTTPQMGQTIDYSIADNAQSINFGDPTTQPNDGLGLLDDNGFILQGPIRSETKHSAGAYEKALFVPKPNGFFRLN